MGESRDLGRRACLRAALLGTAILAGFSGATIRSASAQQVNLIETGSSLLYPLFNLWVPAFAKTHPQIRITTQSTGSGAGISEAISGLAQIGASDAYLSDFMMKKNPGMLNIPLAISSQMINYNLPGLNGDHLKLSGPVLAGIYQGKIIKWNDPAIAQLNPGVSLPDHQIVTIHRTDGSGDTFLFTQYLSFSTPDWQNDLGYGTTISWPAAPGAIGANGNQGMLSALKGNAYSIAYIGISFENAIKQGQLGEAALRNKDGKLVLPDASNVQAAAAAKVKDTPQDGRISLIFAPGPDSYPIVNFEYAIVREQQKSPEEATALKAFLSWAISPSGGNSPSLLRQVNFVPLPEQIGQLSLAKVNQIH